MFESNFNVIYSEAKTGKTRFLFALASVMKDFGFKVFYLGCVLEKNQDFLNFDDYRHITSSHEGNIEKILEVVKEITETRNYDYLFIDDIDFIPNNFISYIDKISVRKIATCLDFSVPKIHSSTMYNLDSISIDTLRLYLSSIVRDKKINSILDDKSR